MKLNLDEIEKLEKLPREMGRRPSEEAGLPAEPRGWYPRDAVADPPDPHRERDREVIKAWIESYILLPLGQWLWRHSPNGSALSMRIYDAFLDLGIKSRADYDRLLELARTNPVTLFQILHVYTCVRRDIERTEAVVSVVCKMIRASGGDFKSVAGMFIGRAEKEIEK